MLHVMVQRAETLPGRLGELWMPLWLLGEPGAVLVDEHLFFSDLALAVGWHTVDAAGEFGASPDMGQVWQISPEAACPAPATPGANVAMEHVCPSAQSTLEPLLPVSQT